MKKTQKTQKTAVSKKRKIRLSGMIFVVFIFSMVAYLASCIVLRSYNVSLNLAKNDYQDQIAVVKRSNELLRSEVNQLKDYERVMGIANGDQTSRNTGTVFTIGE